MKSFNIPYFYGEGFNNVDIVYPKQGFLKGKKKCYVIIDALIK